MTKNWLDLWWPWEIIASMNFDRSYYSKWKIAGTDWDNIVDMTRATNLRFLYEYNIQLRYGTQWDPTNAIELLNYLTSKGYGENIDFELGNGKIYTIILKLISWF